MIAKFKVWHKKKQKWIDDPLLTSEGNVCRYNMFETLDCYSQEDVEICFAVYGFTYQNGEEIYEGDFIQVGDHSKLQVAIPHIYLFLSGMGKVSIKKLGNVYENPNLLKQYLQED